MKKNQNRLSIANLKIVLILIVIAIMLTVCFPLVYENGDWFFNMIKNMDSTRSTTSVATTSEDKEIQVTYATVTNGYDWGPAIDKIILNIGVPVDATTITPDAFTVHAIRTYKDFNFASFTYAAKATEHKVERTVKKAYLSDAMGKERADSQYITLEFEVSPNKPESSPFNYNFITGRNEYIDTTYEISLASNRYLASTDGNMLTFMPARSDDKTDDIQPFSDLFMHDQVYQRDGVTLKFASFTPDKKTEANIPLIIWLHGAGEGGDDTTLAVLGNNVTNLVKEKTQSYFGENGVYVLVPQSPTMWMDFDGNNVYNSTISNSDGHSYYEAALMGLIEQFVAAHPDIDTDRIYIGGCSNGGYMTVKMIIDYPNYFAAAYPAAEAYSVHWLTQARIDAINDFPIWLTHALNDPTVVIAKGDDRRVPIDDFSNALYNRLHAAGNKNAYYSLFENVVDTSGDYLDTNGKPYEYNGHWSWIYTLNNTCIETIQGNPTSLFEWLAKQRRQ